MKRILKIITIMLIILIFNFALLFNTVQAVENESISLYATGKLNKILKYNGILIKTTHVVYEKNQKQYPAYCLNVALPGVEENNGYAVKNEGKITDVGLWRVIINGYPYKTLDQLGVLNEEEAYIATKQSIYCYLYNRGTEKYEGVGETGARTLNAMNIILKNAKESTENIEEFNMEILKNEKWKEDIYNQNYISKEYEIKSNINIGKYLVQLENQITGTKITDVQNNEKNEFNSNEKFKILIPIKNLNKSGEFKINIKTQMESKPVFYGKAPSSDLQDYALTAYSHEDANKQFIDEYEKNDTEILINKQDSETKEILSGAKFEILNENQKVIRVVETDKNGQICLEQLMPGTYYIKEIKAPEGYEINKKLIEIDIELNEKKVLEIGNNKIKIIEEPDIKVPPEITETPKETEELEREVEIPKLPVTGM